MTLDVSLTFVLSVERLAADAASESAHSSVDRTMTQQRTLCCEALAALMTYERPVRRHCMREISRQIGRHFAAVAARELAVAARRRRAHVFGNLLRAQRVFGGPSSSLASFHVQRVHHEVSLDAATTLNVQWCRVVVHYNVFHLRAPAAATKNGQCKMKYRTTDRHIAINAQSHIKLKHVQQTTSAFHVCHIMHYQNIKQ